MREPGRSRVLGIGFDPISLEEAVARVGAMVEARRRGEPPGLVVTANPEMVQAALADAGLRSILEKADLVLPDGVGVVWAGRVLGTPFPGRVPGADLVEALLERGSQRGWRFYFLGGRPSISSGKGSSVSVAQAAASRAVERYPGLKIAGFMHGYFSPAEEDSVVRAVNESGADILLVGMGAPRQEKWIWRNRDRIWAAACIGVGGTLDVLAGAVRRAPPVFRRAGLEWFYRLVTQPSRFGRMLCLPVFAVNVLMERFGRDARGR